ncbi:hypothetical protein BGP79_04860 [Tersicoccus sp. Bi-70]|nr:hypothetical protein BGP79_04860 [Tersicoccus sp. Bi-70]
MLVEPDHPAVVGMLARHTAEVIARSVFERRARCSRVVRAQRPVRGARGRAAGRLDRITVRRQVGERGVKCGV